MKTKVTKYVNVYAVSGRRVVANLYDTFDEAQQVAQKRSSDYIKYIETTTITWEE